MNFLAHAVLAGDDEGLRVGAILGDFVQGVDVDALDDDLRAGVALHRAVDRFTDGHDAFRRTVARLRDDFGHYAPVVADVVYDHALARDWRRWRDEPHGEFCVGVYDALARNDARLPERLRSAWPVMRRHDLLGSYATLDGTTDALARLARRTRHGAVLREADARLGPHVDAIVADFERFFPAVRDFARARRRR